MGEILTFGLHRLSQGNLLGPHLDRLAAGGVDILYSDPPWNAAVLRKFQAMAEREAGRPVEQALYGELCERLADLIARYVRRFAFLECSRLDKDLMLDAVRSVTVAQAVHETVYGQTGRARLIAASVSGEPLPALAVGALKGQAFVDYVLGTVARPGAVVLDPCCGEGITARAALAHGMTFYGNELTQAKVDVLARRLARGRA